jgi:hypothetical protein
MTGAREEAEVESSWDRGVSSTGSGDFAASDDLDRESRLEHPLGAVPGICSAAMGLLAILVAFIAYADFRLEPGARWSWADLPHIVLAFAAVVFFALVPLLATRPQEPDTPAQRSGMRAARLAFAIGAACMLVAIAWFVGRDVFVHHA